MRWYYLIFFEEIGWEVAHWVQLAQDRDKLVVVVSTEIKLRGS
jgi:hypothetical protein